MSPSTHSPEAGSSSSPGADDESGRPRPGLINADDNPFGTQPPPSTSPAATNTTSSFCWSPFSKQRLTPDCGTATTASAPGHQNIDELADDSYTSSTAGTDGHDAGSRTPRPMHGTCSDASDQHDDNNDDRGDDNNEDARMSVSFSSPLPSSRHRESCSETVAYRAASCSSRGLVDESSQNSVGAGEANIFGSSSPLNNNTTSSPITDPSSSQQRLVSSSLLSTPMAAAVERDCNNAGTQTIYSLGEEDGLNETGRREEKEEDSPLARHARGRASSPFSALDENAADYDEVEDDFMDLLGDDDVLAGQDRFSDDFPKDEPGEPPQHASVYQRVITHKNDEIAALTRRYERLETANRFCRCGGGGGGGEGKTAAAARPRDERGRWMSFSSAGCSITSTSTSTSRVDKKDNGSRTRQQRRRRTELELTLATAWRFGYPVEGVLSQHKVREDLVVGVAQIGLGNGRRDGSSGSRVGRRITSEIWNRRRDGV